MIALMEDLRASLPIALILASGVRHRLPDEENLEGKFRKLRCLVLRGCRQGQRSVPSTDSSAVGRPW